MNVSRSGFSIRPRSALVALVGISCVCCAQRQEHVEVVRLAAGSASAASRSASYEATLAAVVTALEAELGLPRLNVAIVLFPDRRAFELGLLQIGYDKALARAASSFNAIGGATAILLNADNVGRLTRTERTKLIAHELVHSVQYQLGGGTRGASAQWLREGFADWLACRITARLGLSSFDALRADLLRELGAAPFGASPVPFQKLATFPQWVEAQGRHEVPLYAQAFIAVELLLEMRGVPAVIEYFERFEHAQDSDGVFVQAFGLRPADFQRAFMQRWHQRLSQARAAASRR